MFNYKLLKVCRNNNVSIENIIFNSLETYLSEVLIIFMVEIFCIYLSGLVTSKSVSPNAAKNKGNFSHFHPYFFDNLLSGRLRVLEDGNIGSFTPWNQS